MVGIQIQASILFFFIKNQCNTKSFTRIFVNNNFSKIKFMVPSYSYLFLLLFKRF